jgi:hypothetical protein
MGLPAQCAKRHNAKSAHRPGRRRALEPGRVGEITAFLAEQGDEDEPDDDAPGDWGDDIAPGTTVHEARVEDGVLVELRLPGTRESPASRGVGRASPPLTGSPAWSGPRLEVRSVP